MGFTSETARKAGTKGGQALLAKRGVGHFQKMGSKGGSTLLKNKGYEYFSKLGSSGGKKRAKNLRKREEEEA